MDQNGGEMFIQGSILSDIVIGIKSQLFIESDEEGFYEIEDEEKENDEILVLGKLEGEFFLEGEYESFYRVVFSIIIILVDNKSFIVQFVRQRLDFGGISYRIGKVLVSFLFGLVLGINFELIKIVLVSVFLSLNFSLMILFLLLFEVSLVKVLSVRIFYLLVSFVVSFGYYLNYILDI